MPVSIDTKPFVLHCEREVWALAAQLLNYGLVCEELDIIVASRRRAPHLLPRLEATIKIRPGGQPSRR